MIQTISDREMTQAAEIKLLNSEIVAYEVTVDNLEAELECESLRLAACGVVAMSDTPESAVEARKMLPEYESASCDDVKRRVDECMSLRAERDALNEAVKGLTAQGVSLAADAARYQWLTADLDMAHGRVQRNQILDRMPTMSYSAACTAIDAAMKETNHD